MAETQTAAATVDYNDWAEWDPRDYNKEYYSEVTLDGRYLMEWVVESLQLAPQAPIAIEFGAGPTVLHMLPLAAKADEIHVAEYLEVNRQEIQRWLDRAPDVHDWGIFTADFLRMEGNA